MSNQPSTPFTRQTQFPRYTYLISKRLDPIFAVAIGLGAALTRIHREQQEQGFTAEQSWETFKRRAVLSWNQPWTWNTIFGSRKVSVASLVDRDAERRGS